MAHDGSDARQVADREAAGRSVRPARPRLPDDRIRARASAYVYGDVLVLAVLLAYDAGAYASWSPVESIGATVGTTYLAHVLSDTIAVRIGRRRADAAGHLLEELRDAVPIAVAGLLPAVAAALSAGGLLPGGAAQVISVAFVLLRLAAVGAVVGRLTGLRAPLPVVASGLGLAVIGAVVAVFRAVVAY